MNRTCQKMTTCFPANNMQEENELRCLECLLSDHLDGMAHDMVIDERGTLEIEVLDEVG